MKPPTNQPTDQPLKPEGENLDSREVESEATRHGCVRAAFPRSYQTIRDDVAFGITNVLFYEKIQHAYNIEIGPNTM